MDFELNHKSEPSFHVVTAD